MKNLCFIHILLFLLMMLIYQCAGAQDYIITTKGDSISGEVKPLSFGVEKKVQVTTPEGKKSVFSILQTKTFRYKDEIYQPVKGEKNYVFMKLLKPGYLSLYAFQQENQVTYDGRYMVKKDGSRLEVPNLSFKKLMSKFLSECPDVVAKIDAGELGKRSVDAIIDEFNACIQNRTLDHGKIIAKLEDQSKKMSAWDILEDKVKSKENFEGKTDALEMITDIRNKIQRDEKVPNFLLDGLKNSLSKADLTTEYENAVKELKN